MMILIKENNCVRFEYSAKNHYIKITYKGTKVDIFDAIIVSETRVSSINKYSCDRIFAIAEKGTSFGKGVYSYFTSEAGVLGIRKSCIVDKTAFSFLRIPLANFLEKNGEKIGLNIKMFKTEESALTWLLDE